jgi:hypothetical protein
MTNKDEKSKVPGLLATVTKKVIENVGAAIAIGIAAFASIVAAWAWAKVSDAIAPFQIPDGTVIASLNDCSRLPGDWSLFVPAGGRFIVGAGSHNNPNVTKIYDAFNES